MASMSAAEYQKLMGVKTAKPNSISSDQWREQMKKQSKKPKIDHVRDIRIMLQLAKIEFVEEHKFHPTRKWRFDFAIVDKKIAIEYEGIFFGKAQTTGKSGHTTVDGFLKDVEKYNEAVKLGWRVLRYTAHSYKQVIDDIGTISAA